MSAAPELRAGQRVRVRSWEPKTYNRTPAYLRGHEGVVHQVQGKFLDQEKQAYGNSGLPRRRLYQVRFPQAALWPDYRGPRGDSLIVDLFEHWLEPLD
jgi:nitrile hydratase